MVENSASSRPLKRARRSARVTADLPDFTAFPPAVSSLKPFRVAVRSFLENNARLTVALPPPVLPCLMTWQILFRVGDLVSDGPDLAPVVLVLDVVEEDVTRSSRSVYCDQCRVVGWSGHPVCRKRYHFIIRSDNGRGMDGYYKSCSSCGNPLQFSDSRCKWCNQLITTGDFEDWVYSQFEDNTHLLHGVVHANGYGHLLTVNGREGGSNVLSGSDIMNFWDRLCTALSVRSGPIDSCFGIIFSWILVDKDLLHWVDSIPFGIIDMEYISLSFQTILFIQASSHTKYFHLTVRMGSPGKTNTSSSIGLSPPQLKAFCEKYPFNEPLYELILHGHMAPLDLIIKRYYHVKLQQLTGN